MLELTHRFRSVLIASALAICAVALTLVYVSHSRTVTQRSSGSVTVFVATQDVAIGTSGAQLMEPGWVATRTVASTDVPSGSVTKLSQLSQLVAVQPTYRGEPLVARRFGTTQQEGVLSVLHGASRIVELPGDAHQLLAGTLKVGNRVDVVGSVKVPESGTTHLSKVLLRDLLVVTAPAKPSGATGPAPDLSVELQLSTAQAERLFWLEKNADWSLLLRPSTRASDPATQPTSATTLFGTGNGH